MFTKQKYLVFGMKCFQLTQKRPCLQPIMHEFSKRFFSDTSTSDFPEFSSSVVKKDLLTFLVNASLYPEKLENKYVPLRAKKDTGEGYVVSIINQPAEQFNLSG